jgi:hypothetical protein
MGDTRSPPLFEQIFTLLASDPTPQHVAWAKKIWRTSFEFDFTPDEMEADKALIKLGLAKDGGKDEDGYPRIVYREQNGRTWETLE